MPKHYPQSITKTQINLQTMTMQQIAKLKEMLQTQQALLNALNHTNKSINEFINGELNVDFYSDDFIYELKNEYFKCKKDDLHMIKFIKQLTDLSLKESKEYFEKIKKTEKWDVL